jgi:hypothetical protein
MRDEFEKANQQQSQSRTSGGGQQFYGGSGGDFSGDFSEFLNQCMDLVPEGGPNKRNSEVRI